MRNGLILEMHSIQLLCWEVLQIVLNVTILSKYFLELTLFKIFLQLAFIFFCDKQTNSKTSLGVKFSKVKLLSSLLKCIF